MAVAIRIEHLSKTFSAAKPALDDVSLEIARGEMVALIGASGSGKSTLLRHVAGLIAADDRTLGKIVVNGRVIQERGRLDRHVRQTRSDIGFVFQQFNLVNRLPVLINVLVGALHRQPLWRSLLRWFPASEKLLGMQALERVGIAECCWQRASTLSGGQQQRAAIARTMVQGARLSWPTSPLRHWTPSRPERSWTCWRRSTAKTAALSWCLYIRSTWP